MKINKKHWYVLDIETEGLDKKKKKSALNRTNNKIIDIGLKNLNTNERVSYPIKHHKKILEVIKENDLKLILHNAGFDITNLMYHYDIDLSENVKVDTLVLARVMYAHLEKMDLESLAVKFLGVKAWKKGAKKTGNEEYLFHDLDYTGDLAKKWLKEITPEQKKVTSWLMRTYREFIRIMYIGVPIDTKHLDDAVKKLGDKEKSILSILEACRPGMNFNSSQQKAKFLYQEQGITIRRFTAKGAPQTDKSALNEIISLGEDIPLSEFVILPDKYKDWGVCKLMLVYQKVNKAKTMGQDWQQRTKDGRLYPYINVTGARTGRTSSSEPNIQQVPQLKLLRNSFNSTEENKIFGEFDYSQIELRVAAFITRDETMMQAYKDGKDLHSLTQEGVYLDEYDHDSKAQRTNAKQYNFGFLYGRQAKGLYAQMVDLGMSVSLKDCEEARSNFHATYPGLQKYYDRIEQECLRDGGVTTAIGRFRATPGIYGNRYEKSEALRAAINTPVQSLASDILISSCAKINQDIDGVQAVATVHDAILVEVDLDIISKEDAEKEIRAIMENPPLFEEFNIDFDIPLIADADWGAWGGA